MCSQVVSLLISHQHAEFSEDLEVNALYLRLRHSALLLNWSHFCGRSEEVHLPHGWHQIALCHKRALEAAVANYSSEISTDPWRNALYHLYDICILFPGTFLCGGGRHFTRALGTQGVEKWDDYCRKGYGVPLELLECVQPLALPMWGAGSPTAVGLCSLFCCTWKHT